MINDPITEQYKKLNENPLVAAAGTVGRACLSNPSLCAQVGGALVKGGKKILDKKNRVGGDNGETPLGDSFIPDRNALIEFACRVLNNVSDTNKTSTVSEIAIVKPESNDNSGKPSLEAIAKHFVETGQMTKEAAASWLKLGKHIQGMSQEDIDSLGSKPKDNDDSDD